MMRIKCKQLIYPLFVVGGKRRCQKIPSMPGVYRFSVDQLLIEMEECARLGIKNYLLFGIPSRKDNEGSQAYCEENIVALAVSAFKNKFPRINLMTDVCLCAYTDHGHCGVVDRNRKNINRKKTLVALGKMAVSFARAGADYVCPSAMTNGQVFAIRQALDANGYQKTKIMGYSAKFSSHFYGPFRDIANSSPQFGDRRGYQLDCRKGEIALQKIDEDISAGADIVMVKPSLSYLDIICKAKKRINHPLAVYNVSGEYAMVKQGVKAGFWKEESIVDEIMTSLLRAGADYIITYHAKDIAMWMRKHNDKK